MLELVGVTCEAYGVHEQLKSKNTVSVIEIQVTFQKPRVGLVQIASATWMCFRLRT